jgi:hypothetical protein
LTKQEGTNVIGMLGFEFLNLKQLPGIKKDRKNLASLKIVWSFLVCHSFRKIEKW